MSSITLRLLKSLFILPRDETKSFKGKTVLITGANTGLGLEAAKKIASLNASKLIITARTMEKGQAAKTAIEEHVRLNLKTPVGEPTIIEIFLLEMGDFQSVKTFAENINTKIKRLDAVILNAGLFNKAWTKTVDGWEEVLAINAISTTLLGLHLLAKLSTTADSSDPAHLTFISSGLATNVKPELARQYVDAENSLEAMSAEKAWPGGQAQYGLSKLILEYSQRHMGRLPSVYDASGKVKVIVNSACPGLCKTDLARQYTKNNQLLQILVWVLGLMFMRTAGQGARTYVSALTRDETSQGQLWKDDMYFYGGHMLESEEGRQFGEKAWKEVMEVVAKVDPRVEGTLQ